MLAYSYLQVRSISCVIQVVMFLFFLWVRLFAGLTYFILNVQTTWGNGKILNINIVNWHKNGLKAYNKFETLIGRIYMRRNYGHNLGDNYGHRLFWKLLTIWNRDINSNWGWIIMCNNKCLRYKVRLVCGIRLPGPARHIQQSQTVI